jgi:two-component system sensor histidine kinase PilS (NtrC family)
MQRALPMAGTRAGTVPGRLPFEGTGELHRRLLWLIAVRAAILLLGLNLARPLGILPDRLGPLPFLPFFHLFSITLAFGYLAMWWSGRRLMFQLYLQITIDLAAASVLVACTRGSESPFISFYLLIIIYCSLALGRNGGVIGAALSTILYAGIVALIHLDMLAFEDGQADLNTLTFRISLHALGFFSVAFLGADLSRRLHNMQQVLQEKIDSLQLLERLTDRIVSSIRSGLLTTDLDGRITLYNSAAEEITEMARDFVLGDSIRSVIGSDLWARILGTNLLRNSRPLRYEEWVQLPGGARRYLGYSVSPLLDARKKLTGYIIAFQDLTDIKRLEEEVRIKDRMADVGRMAAGIAHEIRNPLAAMRGSVEILRSHLDLRESDERLFDILVRESDRLNAFVEEFLSFARPSQGVRKSLDLAPLLRDWFLLLKNSPEARKKHHIELSVRRQPIPILGDADKLRQVFWNLAQNALRSMPEGGTLMITADASDEQGAEIVFQDTGVGMSEEEMEHLFQPFQSGFSGGVGLGLSILFQIMEDHQGRIRFDSEKGRGTKVSLTFPPAADALIPSMELQNRPELRTVC